MKWPIFWKTGPLTGEVWPNSSYLVLEVTVVTKVPCDSHSPLIPTVLQYLFSRESVTLLSELSQDMKLTSPIYETVLPGPQLVDLALWLAPWWGWKVTWTSGPSPSSVLAGLCTYIHMCINTCAHFAAWLGPMRGASKGRAKNTQ